MPTLGVFLVFAWAEVLPTAQLQRTGSVDCAHYHKDAMLGSFHAICNCCSCCLSRAWPRGCWAMQAWHIGTPTLASSGYMAHVDADVCADDRQFDDIPMNDGFAPIAATACMGGGLCI